MDDEAGRARREGVLVAAEIGSGPGLRNTTGDFQGGRRNPADAPDSEDVAFAIGDGDDAVRRNLKGAGGGLVDDPLDIDSRELRPGGAGPEKQSGGEQG